MRYVCRILGIFLWLTTSGVTDLYGQTTVRHTVSGFVYEKGSRETLIGVNVFVPELNVGTVTNNYGFYSITLPTDSVTIVYSYVGYAREQREIVLNENIRMDIELDSSVELEEVVVTDERMRRISQSTQMSRLEIPMQQARTIPSFLGEKDMFKVLQLMPGVQSGNEGTSGFYVRGGGPDQNLIILDDAIVYNANHLFGFFSVFNGDAIKNMELYKGGFPSRFGGRLSSVLDIQMKDGSKEKFQGEAGIGLISSRLTLEGPVIKDKASFLVSGRRTYLDLLIRPFLPEETKAGYFFYDLNSKFNYDINPNNRIFVSGYFGRDKFFLRDSWEDQISVDRMETGLFWQNATGTLRWNHIFNDRLFANLSLVFSEYELTIFSEESYRDLQNNQNSVWELRYNSGIRDIGAKYDLTWNPSPQHYIRAGVQTIQHKFTPSAIVLRDDDIGQMEQNTEILQSVESGLYIEDEITLGEGVKINPGIRFSHFYADGKSYPNLEPRFASNVRILSDLSWKASFASMNQYVHLLSSTGIGLPTDLWVPSTDRIRPQKTWQVASGFAYDWIARNLEISVEGYYKKASDLIGYKEGASFLLIDDPSEAETFTWQDNITHG
ncbi:MAG: TonB-dependent receptor, partial [Bacteroidota bacterium]